MGENIIDTETEYSMWVSLSLLLICVQLLKNLDFHPKLGIVTRTIGAAAADLMFFLVLFIMVNLIFAFLGVVIFGNFSERFNNLPNSFLTCLDILMGMYDANTDVNKSSNMVLGLMFMWGFYLITFFRAAQCPARHHRRELRPHQER